MLDPKFHFLGRGEDQLVQIVQDELEGFGAGLVGCDDLGDNGSVERFVFYLLEERK